MCATFRCYPPRLLNEIVVLQYNLYSLYMTIYKHSLYSAGTCQLARGIQVIKIKLSQDLCARGIETLDLCMRAEQKLWICVRAEQRFRVVYVCARAGQRTTPEFCEKKSRKFKDQRIILTFHSTLSNPPVPPASFSVSTCT